MLEICETTIISNQMNHSIRGKIVKDVVVGNTPHKFGWFYEPIDHYVDLLVGNQVIETKSIGSMIEVSFLDQVVLILGEGEEIIYFSKNDSIPSKHQLMIVFDDDTGFYVKVKLYGWLLVGKQEDLLKDILYYRLAKTRPNVLSSAFTYEYFDQSILKPNMKQSLKAALATKQNIPGLGNGTLQDCFWKARLNPKMIVSTLTENQKYSLYQSIQHIVQLILSNQGRHNEVTLYGQPGTYKVMMSNLTSICENCKQPIKVETYLGGKIYYCDHCQPYSK